MQRTPQDVKQAYLWEHEAYKMLLVVLASFDMKNATT